MLAAALRRNQPRFFFSFYVVPFTPASGRIASRGVLWKKVLPPSSPRFDIANALSQQLHQEFIELVDISVIREDINNAQKMHKLLKIYV